MWQVKVTKGDYDALAEAGTRAGAIIGVFADKAEADALAAEMADDCGLACKVSSYKMTPEETRRAKILASFGKAYVPAHVEPAGKWESQK